MNYIIFRASKVTHDCGDLIPFRQWRLSRWTLMLALFMFSCALTHEREKCEVEISLFHLRFNSEDYGEIYDAASPEFREVSKKGAFVDYLGSLKREFGKQTGSTPGPWRVDKTIWGTYVTAKYMTTYERGVVEEEFAFIIRDGNPSLFRFNFVSAEQSAPTHRQR